MEVMGKRAAGLVLATSALALCGCGTLAAAEVGPAGGVAATDPAPVSGGLSSGPRMSAAQVPAPPEPTFPLTIRRVGGAAAFNDTLVVRADGDIRVNTRAVHGRVCHLRESQRTDLFDALRTVRLSPGRAAPVVTTSGTPEAGWTADDAEPPTPIRITVTDVHQRLVDLSDPSLGGIASGVGALVQDATLSSPIAIACRDTTSATG